MSLAILGDPTLGLVIGSSRFIFRMPFDWKGLFFTAAFDGVSWGGRTYWLHVPIVGDRTVLETRTRLEAEGPSCWAKCPAPGV